MLFTRHHSLQQPTKFDDVTFEVKVVVSNRSKFETVKKIKMADLRDDKVVRASYFAQLLDLEGNDLRKVYEPISNQIGYIMCFFVLLMTAHFAWKRYKRWVEEKTPIFIPYKVIKPPTAMLADKQQQKLDGGKLKKRVCAVVGGTGFIGSGVVDELVSRGDYYVFALGRKFRPERTNPNVDCMIQVDVMDLDGLTNAFQGVDSVVNAAAFVPNVFSTKDQVYSKNRLAFTHVIKAAKAAKVKSLVHLGGIHIKTPKDPILATFMNALIKTEEEIAAANGDDGLHTCIIGPSNIVGRNSDMFGKLLTGEITSMPMSSAMPVSFMPVEYLTKALVNAEAKLSDPSAVEEVGGKIFQLRGEPMSWADLLTLKEWPHQISKSPAFVMGMLVKVNVICATLCRWAPFGADLAPFVLEILKVVEEAIPEEEVQETYKVLDIGPPNPPIREYIRSLAERCKESKKEN